MNVRLVYLFVTFVTIATADEHSHMYQDGEEVVLWMNTVGPYHNRQETYRYFSLPFCRGPKEEISHHHETMGEALQGVELDYSGLEIGFRGNVPSTKYCSVKLDEIAMRGFSYAVMNFYWYQAYIDDLPLWGVVGEIDKKEYLLIYTHKKFDIGFNGNQIVDVNLTSERKVQLKLNTEIEFTYEVNWKQSSVEYAHRFNKYLDPSFFQHRIHWFSIFNSFMMVIFLVGLVSMIMLRTLRKDYARYTKDNDLADLERDLGDEYGWKQIHGDVFRAPKYPILFTSLIGTGGHLVLVSLASILLALIEDLYTQRGTLLSTTIFIYAVTSPACGFLGGALYLRMGGRHWIRQMFCGMCVFPTLVGSAAFVVNIVAMYYHASRAIPLMTMLSIVGIVLFVIVPLNCVGTILGRNLAGHIQFPCRINTVPRPIPDRKWFLEPSCLALLGGILPFGSIFIEVYFIFTSFWQYKIYYVFGFMLLVFVIMMIVTVCVTIVCTYFLVNGEDYRWQWTSFGSGASIGLYVFIYAIYYFFFKTKMYGLFQTVFYFSYSLVGTAGIGILCGTIGYVGASEFVWKIYSTVKID